jgi:hypothetical protein
MTTNALINLLPHKNQESLLSKAELVELSLSQSICKVNEHTTHVFFPINSFISITQSIDHYPPIEIGMIGREGLLGAETLLGVSANPFGALVQGAGSAWKMESNFFISQMKSSLELKKIVKTYLGTGLISTYF